MNGLEVTSALVAPVDFVGEGFPRKFDSAFLEGSARPRLRKRDVIRLRRLDAGPKGVEKLNPLVALGDEIPVRSKSELGALYSAC